MTKKWIEGERLVNYLAETESWKLYKVIDAKGIYYDLYCKVNNCVTRFTHLRIDGEGNYELSYG